MCSDEIPYRRLPSTRWAWRQVKILTPPSGPHQNGAAGPSRLSLSQWKPTDPLSLTVTYRGGAEAWYAIRARGGELRIPGVICLHDVMREVYEGNLYPLRKSP